MRTVLSGTVRVGMGDYKICKAPQKISTLGLGSCLGVVFYDETTHICGMAHVMLPDSSVGAGRKDDPKFRMRYMDTCLSDMLHDLQHKHWVRVENLVAKIAGGAQMRSDRSGVMGQSIGEKNADVAMNMIGDWGIQLVDMDIGENYSRTIIFDPMSGYLEVQRIGADTIVL